MENVPVWIAELEMDLDNHFVLTFDSLKEQVEGMFGNVAVTIEAHELLGPEVGCRELSRYAQLLGSVRRYLSPDLQQKGFSPRSRGQTNRSPCS